MPLYLGFVLSNILCAALKTFRAGNKSIIIDNNVNTIAIGEGYGFLLNCFIQRNFWKGALK